jgi:hypothetical protein
MNLLIGEKVTYIPFLGCDPSQYQNGMVKSHPEHTTESVFVVFNCAGEWKNFKDYTAALTPVSKLRKGWISEIACDHYFISDGPGREGRTCQDCGEKRDF